MEAAITTDTEVGGIQDECTSLAQVDRTYLEDFTPQISRGDQSAASI